MKTKLFSFTFTLLLSLWTATAQVTVSGSASGNGSYATLAEAISAIPLLLQTGNNITVAISASTTESSTITIGNGDWSSLKIYPTASGLTCSSVYILLNGAKNVTIDGRVNQTGTPAVGATESLTLSSTSTTNPVISFDNDAQNNTVKYCTIKIGGLTATTSGGILFGATAVTTNGNGNNVIDRNLITSSGATYPIYAINALGNATKPNTGNQITNNEFTNFMAAGSAAIGIRVLGDASANFNDNYTISGNSMYGNIVTNSGGNRIFIQIGAAGNGGSHTITGNYIGGSSAQCGGAKMVKSGSVVSNFLGISVSTSGAGTSLVQNNTIQNIEWNAASGQNSAQNFTGITVAGTGSATISGNVIGNTTTSASSSSTASIVSSIYSTSNSSVNGISITSIGNVTCENNQIGSIYAINNHATTPAQINFNGINKTAVAGNTTIRNNTIGSPSIANSIYHTFVFSTYPAQNMNGINCVGTGTNNVSNNTIANLTNSTATGYFYGITIGGALSTGTVNANLIHSLTPLGYTGTGLVGGIQSANGTNTITNNIIKLGDDNVCNIRGILENSNNSGITSNIYHNTVYISGSPATGSFPSYCFQTQNTTSTRNFKNNIFVNARSNSSSASGKHYALYISSTNGTSTADYNDYLVTGTGGVLGYYAAEKASLPILPSPNDDNSLNVDPSFANAGGTSASDYIPANKTLIGVSSTGVTTDYSGSPRVEPYTMGAFEVLTTALNISNNSFVEIIHSPDGQIAIKGIEVGKGKVYSSQGKLVKSFTTNTFNINNPQKGIYILSVTDKSGTVHNSKFIM